MKKAGLTEHLPLSAAGLQILLALAAGDMHGYAIMQEVARQSEGRYKVGPGTLYDSLQRMTSQGLVREISPRDAKADRRRRYYRLGALGRRVLAAELERLESVLREGRIRLGKARPAGAS